MGRTAKSKKNRLAALVLIVCMGAAAVLCVGAWRELRERREGEAYYEALAMTHGSDAAPMDTVRPDELAMPSVEDVPLAASKVDFAALRETCPDVVGWVEIEGTQIDYPVVHGADNDFYLTHLPDGTENSAGSIMMDVSCDETFRSEISILHGHHMRNKTMFGGLDAYKDEKYYQEHPTVRLYTPDGDFDAQIFAAYTVDGERFGYPTSFDSDAAFDAFVAEARAKSSFRTEVEIERGDRILMLSTCEYSFEGARFIVAAKIVENAPAQNQ